MMRLNNKGQTLILFVILIPIFLIIIAMIVDLGNSIITRHELESSIDLTIRYGLDHIDNNDVSGKMNDLFKLNQPDGNIKIDIKDNKIYIKSSVRVDGIFSKFINIPIYEIENNYVGYKKNSKYIIEKN